MYNVNKGENTLEESEMLEAIHSCLREIIARDEAGTGHLIEYSEHDIIAITLLYTKILGNRLAGKLADEKVSLKYSEELALSYGEMVRQLTKSMSGIDVIKHFGGNDD